jgi:hypothetical protein
MSEIAINTLTTMRQKRSIDLIKRVEKYISWSGLEKLFNLTEFVMFSILSKISNVVHMPARTKSIDFFDFIIFPALLGYFTKKVIC